VAVVQNAASSDGKTSRARPWAWRKLLPSVTLLCAAFAAGAAMMHSSAKTPAAPPNRKVEVVARYPHDPKSFCQGLVVHNGALIEGTGRYQQSKLRRIELQTGQVQQEIQLQANVFGEGVTVFEDRILQLTWKNNSLIVYDVNTFRQLGVVRYRDIDNSLREGWGITHDGTHLIISDGTSRLRFCDPRTYRVVRRVNVRNGFRSLSQLNELEYVDGMILANVWYEDRIARIDPKTGNVVDWLDLKSIKPSEVRWDREAVLNGIAWDATKRRLFVTGKNWPTLFEIRIPDPPAQ
jgi:glutaminyl-peptide cyclotransferase